LAPSADGDLRAVANRRLPSRSHLVVLAHSYVARSSTPPTVLARVRSCRGLPSTDTVTVLSARIQTTLTVSRASRIRA